MIRDLHINNKASRGPEGDYVEPVWDWEAMKSWEFVRASFALEYEDYGNDFTLDGMAELLDHVIDWNVT